jgi:hypothetical protein
MATKNISKLDTLIHKYEKNSTIVTTSFYATLIILMISALMKSPHINYPNHNSICIHSKQLSIET